MSSLALSVLSTEYVKIPVTALVDGLPVDPSVDVVEIAFMTTGNPGSGDWQTSDWETIGSTVYARCLVGPAGTVTLTEGTYVIWIKVTDSPEIPVKKASNTLVIS